MANCASCRGYHDILPSSDPRSAVAPVRLGETCGKYHPGVSAKFQVSRVHVAMTTADQPVLFMLCNLYLLLIIMTISFMLVHEGLDFAGKIRHHLRVQSGEADPHTHALKRSFVRMTLGERIQHALLLDLLPRFKDAVDLFQNLLFLTGLRKSPPQFDRFGYIEKMEYWALIWGTVAMTVTGMLLWFENQSLQVMSKWMLDPATVVHYYEAWLAFLASSCGIPTRTS